MKFLVTGGLGLIGHNVVRCIVYRSVEDKSATEYYLRWESQHGL
jgi:dTDP-D-glucose 4,6-dehydratase